MSDNTKKIVVSNEVYKKLSKVKQELKSRGVLDISSEDILDFIILDQDCDKLTQYIELKTPDTYKLQELSTDTDFQEQLKRLIKSYEKKKKVSQNIDNPSALPT